MLGKLLKHEFGQTARTLVPLFAGTTIALLLAKLLAMLTDKFQSNTTIGAGTVIRQNPVLSMLSGIAMFLFVTFLLVLLAGTMVVAIQRFYRILGDEGYVMFALPVTPAQHILSKTICAISWMVAMVAYFVISMWVLLFVGIERSSVVINDQFVWGFGARGYLLMTLMIVCMIMGMLSALWMLYVSCTIGAQFGQNRLLASVGAFFVLQFVLQILGVVLLLVVGNALDSGSVSMQQWFFNLRTSATFLIDSMNLGLGIAIGVLALTNVVFYAVMHRILKKKLNLA